MGMFKSVFKTIQQEAEKAMGKEPKSTFDPTNPPTRWEKAIIGMNAIVGTVQKVDPDGIDVYCFPGTGTDQDVFRQIKDINGLEALVTAAPPQGPCKMGEAMKTVLNAAFERGFQERPCSILVLTAGRPDDHEELTKTLADAAKKVQKDSDLSVTFVQVGDDEWATKYLAQLDTELKTTSESGEEIDIVDTIKDEDIKKVVGEIKGGSGAAGGIVGAFAGAALGVGGLYLMNKMNATKRTAGWNGKWNCIWEGEVYAELTIVDDGEGNLQISGWPDNEGSFSGSYAEKEDGGYHIEYTSLVGNDTVVGTVDDEHTISWDDGTRWEEIPPEGGHWATYAGAAAAGAAAVGATGYLLDKKFFNKASKGVKSDYVIILDRSARMVEKDAGK